LRINRAEIYLIRFAKEGNRRSATIATDQALHSVEGQPYLGPEKALVIPEDFPVNLVAAHRNTPQQ
jgi:hypothetical protein